jgi:hypothetical protein
VGESELEASKEGRKLANFKYACIGYSIYLDNKDSSPDSQDKTAKLPFCVGLEVLYLSLLSLAVYAYEKLCLSSFKGIVGCWDISCVTY